MSVPNSIIRLVDTFHRNIDSFKSGNYNETQVRREFIDPLFKALGWDIDNERGYAEAYKDVIHEYSQKTKDTVKAPDYYFRIGGTGKFFVEAKKPSVNIEYDIHPAFQLRRYGWSAKLPLSILTDFEEFAVYDCRVPPKKNDKASTARIKFITYDEFIERWDELEEIFSREAVLKGSFDKFAESTKKKRGTAEVDEAFLKAMEQWRTMLARNIALRNSNLSIRELNFSVQKTIDRMIFLRICEDRGIEDYGELMNLLNGTNIYGRLKVIFTRADEKYNSGLFHFEEEKGREEPPDELTPNISIDDKVLKEIIKNLYYPESPYEFSVLPADILGQVYEQFLGKVIRLTPAHHAIIEDKPEVKKAGGVYYTPTYIVDYIVKNTVGKILEKKTPKQIAKIRILDPACGSGSFILGAYQYLLDWHLNYYNKHINEKGIKPGSKKSPVYEAANGEIKLTTAERKRILLNNLYGVDIDLQAVEVTKLSLLLKVLEGESEETLTNQMRMFRQRALPDLANNIKCGNSLINPDFYDQTKMNFLDEEEKLRINVFDWNTEFNEIVSNGGFDVVIGNPPYVLLNLDLFSQSVINYLNKYKVAKYKTDLFHLFIEQGIYLIKQNGQFGMIVPNPWLTMKFTDKLREYILRNSSIEEIVFFEHKVFKNADVYTLILLLGKNFDGVDPIVTIKKPKYKSNALTFDKNKYEIKQKEWLINEDYIFEIRLIGSVGKLIDKIVKSFPKLQDVARASLGCQAYNSIKHTKEQIKQRVFHSSTKLSNEYLKELAGNDVKRYIIDRKKGEWIKYGPWLHDYRTLDWLEGPRILVREIPGKPPYSIQACYVEEKYCNYKTILNVNPSENTNFSVKYLCGLLNSKLLSFLYPYCSNKIITESFPRISVGDLKKLPIKAIAHGIKEEKILHDKIVKLVDTILLQNQKIINVKTPQENIALQRQIEAVDKKIDQIVYKLYDLTAEEIKIVEESSG